MSDLKASVALTNSTVDPLSRHELLDWVNSTVHGQFKKVDELCSGVAYCQLMELLFPNCIGIKKIKLNAKLEHEYLHNLKLLQAGFGRLKFDKTVPIERLIKGRFQDNLEFLQWFRKFYDTYATGKENLKVPAAVAAAAANVPKPIRKPPASTAVKSKPVISAAVNGQPKLPAPTEDAQMEAKRSPSPLGTEVLQAGLDELKEQFAIVDTDRNHFYTKLVKIEALLHDSIAKNEDVEWCKRALTVIYAATGDQQSRFEAEEDF